MVRRGSAVTIATMGKLSFLLALLACACGSDSSGAASNYTGDSGNAACPDLTGTWAVTKHCDASFVGESAPVSQHDCMLSFASLFDGFHGTVGGDGTVTVSGPQSCTGKAAASSIALSCTPGTCEVTLTRSK
jgi:hypothetical protein